MEERAKYKTGKRKTWIKIKRGLVTSPKHREKMGMAVWLFMHIIDGVDWETGKFYEWRDADEAEAMNAKLRTLRSWRQKLEEEGYIVSKQKFQCLEITIKNWHNPRSYGGEVLNTDEHGDSETVPSDEHGDIHGDIHAITNNVTPTLSSHITYHNSAGAEKVLPSVAGIGWAMMADRKVNDADVAHSRGQTNEMSAASWRNAGLSETLVQIAYTFAVAFGKAMPPAPQKKEKAPVYYVWKEGAEKLQTIHGKRDRLQVIKELGAEYNQNSNGFGTVTNPASILNKVYDKMNETAQVLKPDNGTIRM